MARDRAMQPPVPQSRIPVPTNAVPPKNLVVTFKCEHGGRISFSDQPCANGAKTLAVTAAEAVSSPKAMDNLQKLKAPAAAMEADRHARERQFEIAAAETAKVLVLSLIRLLYGNHSVCVDSYIADGEPVQRKRDPLVEHATVCI